MVNLDTFRDGIFHVWQPNAVDLVKSSEKDDRWEIGGYASTDALDRQNESVYQKGLDFSEFIEHGYYNDNHQQHTAAAVGIPELARFDKGQGWYTEGYLLKETQRAREIYSLAKALQNTPRRLGFSIEGKILERMGNKIVRALIRNVAITNSPVNTECTWDIISKSWASDIDAKALAVGHARVASEGGRVLVPEDLEKDEIKYVYYCPHCKKGFSSTLGVETHVSKSHALLQSPTLHDYPQIYRRAAKSLTAEEAVSYLHRLRPEYSEAVCKRLVEYVFESDQP